MHWMLCARQFLPDSLLVKRDRESHFYRCFLFFKTVQWFLSYVHNSILFAQPPYRLSATTLDCPWTVNKEPHGQSALFWLPPDYCASTSAFQGLWPGALVVPTVLSYGSLLRNSRITWYCTQSVIFWEAVRCSFGGTNYKHRRWWL